MTPVLNSLISFLRRRRSMLLAISAVLLSVVLVAQPSLTRPVRAADNSPVYTDALASPWQDWSWDTTVSFANATPVHSGSASIAVTYTAAWGGLYFHTDTALPTSGYSSIRFWVHGGAGGGQSVNFHVNDGVESYPFIVQANTWSQVIVPLTALGSPASLSDLKWQDNSGGAQATFYIDDISLVGTSSIYADTLASAWADWSWDTTVSFANATPVHSGSASIAVTYAAAWGGLYFHADTAQPTAGYNAIRFWVHGGAGGGQSINFHVNDGAESYPFIVQANTWSQVIVPLSALGSPASLTALVWQDNRGEAQPPFYLDDVSLVWTTQAAPLHLPLVVRQYAASMPYKGVNLAGADFGEDSLPGILDKDYTYPTAAEVDYFTGKGMTIIRLPFRWERLQRRQLAVFNAAEQARHGHVRHVRHRQGRLCSARPAQLCALLRQSDRGERRTRQRIRGFLEQVGAALPQQQPGDLWPDERAARYEHRIVGQRRQRGHCSHPPDRCDQPDPGAGQRLGRRGQLGRQLVRHAQRRRDA